MKLFSFRNFRVLALLALLFVAWVYTQQQQRDSTSWLAPLEVVIFPINADGSTNTRSFIRNLDTTAFKDIDHFFKTEGTKFRLLSKHPVITTYGEEVSELPPKPPLNGSQLDIMLWSLKLRYWAWSNTPDDKSNKNRVRVYVIYHENKGNNVLPHSLGLRKGLIGIVHAFADEQQQSQNNVIVAHEILHTVGATDKYDQSTGQPLAPYGLAVPDRDPVYPQYRAEIMAARVALTETTWRMAKSLRRAVIGYKTASEIGWTDASL